MAELSLKIKADFDEAQRQFKALAENSEETRAKMEKFTQSFSGDHADKFIDKQKLAGAAITATRGDVAAMEAQSAAYQREIERLIKSGLNPQSEAVQKLAKEQQALKEKIKEAADVQKAQELAVKGAEKAFLACYAAIGASLAALGAMAQKTAEAGDHYAKTARQIGMTAEELQKLEYAAKLSGVDNLEGSLQKLNKSMSDLHNGSGALVKALEGSNDAMLAQIKGAKSNEQAYRLVLKAIREAPDSFKRAEIAQAAFGRSGQDIINMALADNLDEMCVEAERYGIISNENAKAAEAYIDAQTRFKQALKGVSTEIGSALIPGLTDLINKAADFIAGIDNWEEILINTGIALGIITAGVTAFVIAAKGAAIVKAFTVAIKAFFAAVNSSAGVIGLAAMALTTIIALMSKFSRDSMFEKQAEQADALSVSLSKQSEELNKLTSAFEGVDRTKNLDAQTTDNLIRLYPQLTDYIKDNIKTVGDLMDAREALHEQQVLLSVQSYMNQINQLSQEMRRLEREDTNRSRRRQSEINAQVRDYVANMNTILETIGKKVEWGYASGRGYIIDIINTAEREFEEHVNNILAETNRLNKSMAQLLNDAGMTEQQKMNERINQAAAHFKARADLERAEGEARIASVQNEYARMRELAGLNNEELIALERAKNETIQNIRDEMEKEARAREEEARQENERLMQNELDVAKRLAEEEKRLLDELADYEKTIYNKRIEAATAFFSGMSAMLNAFAGENKGMLFLAKTMAASEAAVNSFVAFTQALRDPTPLPTPLRAAQAAGILASGLATQAKIWSAETGGSFIVPDVSPRVDGALAMLRVQGNERINVEPRSGGGEAGTQIFNLVFNGQVLASAVNKLARRGELYTLQLAGNY